MSNVWCKFEERVKLGEVHRAILIVPPGCRLSSV
jgi:hypothetical protein